MYRTMSESSQVIKVSKKWEEILSKIYFNSQDEIVKYTSLVCLSNISSFRTQNKRFLLSIEKVEVYLTEAKRLNEDKEGEERLRVFLETQILNILTNVMLDIQQSNDQEYYEKVT